MNMYISYLLHTNDNNVRNACYKLTFDIDGDPFADRGRHTIGRDAEISTHFAACDPRQV